MNKKISIYSNSSRVYVPRAYGDYLKLERFNRVECVTDGDQVALVFSRDVFFNGGHLSAQRAPKSEKDGYNFSNASFADIVRSAAKGSPYEGENIKIVPLSEKDEGKSMILLFNVPGRNGAENDTEEEKGDNAPDESPPAPVDVKARAAIRALSVELKKSGVFGDEQVRGIISMLSDW